jgi:hypothetical protein
MQLIGIHIGISGAKKTEQSKRLEVIDNKLAISTLFPENNLYKLILIKKYSLA